MTDRCWNSKSHLDISWWKQCNVNPFGPHHACHSLSDLRDMALGGARTAWVSHVSLRKIVMPDVKERVQAVMWRSLSIWYCCTRSCVTHSWLLTLDPGLMCSCCNQPSYYGGMPGAVKTRQPAWFIALFLPILIHQGFFINTIRGMQMSATVSSLQCCWRILHRNKYSLYSW